MKKILMTAILVFLLVAGNAATGHAAPPTAQDQTAYIETNVATTITLKVTDDADINNLTFTLDEPPLKGALAPYTGSNHSIKYTPLTDDCANTYTFKYHVTDTEGQDSPQATVTLVVTKAVVVGAGPDQIDTPVIKSTSEPLSIQLEGSATDPDNYPGPLDVTWSVIRKPTGAIVEFNDINSPNTEVSFSLTGYYQLQLTAKDGAFTKTDSVVIRIKGDSDADTPTNLPPVVKDQKVRVRYTSNPYSIVLLADDPDEDPLTLEIIDPPRHGSLAQVPGTHVYASTSSFFMPYTPDPGYIGTDSFTFKVKDDGDPALESNVATMTLDIKPWEPPIGIPEPPLMGNGNMITVSHRMYDGQTFDYSQGGTVNDPRGVAPYGDAGNGPYTHYVDNSSLASTDNLNPYGTPHKPRKTIPSLIPEGSVVEIHHGIDGASTLYIITNGTPERPVFVRGYNPADPSIVKSHWIVAKGSYSIWENLRMHNCGWGARIHDGMSSHYMVFRNSESYGDGLISSGCGVATYGVAGNGCNDIVFYNNHIHHGGDSQVAVENDTHAVTVGSYAFNVWILDSHLHHMGGDSVQTGHNANFTSHHVYVGRNDMHDNDEDAVDIKQTDDVIVSQNDMYHFGKDFHPARGGGTGVVIHYGPSRIYIINNKIHDAGDGVISSGATEINLIGNIIYNISQMEADTHGDTSIYRPAAGFHWRSTENVYAVNNVIYDTAVGIEAYVPDTPAHIVNNVISQVKNDNRPGYHLILTGAGLSASTIDHNLFYQDTGTIMLYIGEGQSTNDIRANPLFSDPVNHNFDLQPGSPAINAGIVSEVYQRFYGLYSIDIQKDINGTSRPQETGWDIGAYEYAPAGVKASCTASPLRGNTRTSFVFDASASISYTGTIVRYEWDFDYDGNFTADFVSTGNHITSLATHVYNAPRPDYRAALRVINSEDIASSIAVSDQIEVVDPALYNSAPQLSGATLSPTTGDITTGFVFKVTYTDAENNPPNNGSSLIKVWLSGIPGTTGPVPLLMNKTNSSDLNFADGVEYSATKSGLIKYQNYSYYITATDQISPEVRVPASGELPGPVVNNAAPKIVVSAGNAVLYGQEFTLDASQTYDPDQYDPQKDTLSYLWEQTGGTPVSINNPTQPIATFTAPSGDASLIFKLTVKDSDPVNQLTSTYAMTAQNKTDILVRGAPNTFYVADPKGSDGVQGTADDRAEASDSNDGLALDRPFVTIQKAADTIRSGDTALVSGGTYDGFDYHPAASGTANGWITIQGRAGETVTLNSTQTSKNIFEFSAARTPQTAGFGYIAFKSLKLTGCNNGWNFEFPDSRIHHITLEDVEVYNSNQALRASGMGVAYFTAVRAEAQHNHANGWTFRNNDNALDEYGSGSHDISFIDSSSHDNDDGASLGEGDADGWTFQASNYNITLTNCVAYNNNEDGLDFKADNVVIDRCKSYNNGASQIKMKGAVVGDPGGRTVNRVHNYLVRNTLAVDPPRSPKGNTLNWRENSNIIVLGSTFVNYANGPALDSSFGADTIQTPVSPLPVSGSLKNVILTSMGKYVIRFNVVQNVTLTSENNLYYRYNFPDSTNAFRHEGSILNFAGWQAKSGTDAQSVYANPQFVNAPEFGEAVAAPNGSVFSIYDASKYAIGDVIEYNDDGVVRHVTAVDAGAKTITLDSAPAPAKGMGICNWRAKTNLAEDYRLQSGSQGIDHGADLREDNILEDYAQSSRPLDGDADGTAKYDIGAYEYMPSQGEPIAGDVNDDKAINVLDVQACVNIILGVDTDPGDIARAKQLNANFDDPVTVTTLQAIVNKILG